MSHDYWSGAVLLETVLINVLLIFEHFFKNVFDKFLANKTNVNKQVRSTLIFNQKVGVSTISGFI